MRVANLSKMVLFNMCTALAISCAVGVHAQESTEGSGRETVNILTDDITTIEVIGERPLTKNEVSRGVREIAQSINIGSPLERFHDPLCLSVTGLGEQLNVQVATLIRENARDATMEIADDGCMTNALVIVVDNPERLIERLRVAQPRLFSSRSRQEISGALYRNDPAIAWSAAEVRGASGSPTSPLSGRAGAEGISDNGSTVPVIDTFIPSRLNIGFSVGRINSVVVFDVRKLEGVHINQLASYATLFLIGTPRRLPDYENIGGTSILTLFEGDPVNAPIGLTQLDRAYLRGLYSLRPNENSTRLALSTRAAYSEISSFNCGEPNATCEVEPEAP